MEEKEKKQQQRCHWPFVWRAEQVEQQMQQQQ